MSRAREAPRLGGLAAVMLLAAPDRASAHEVFGLTGFPAAVLHPFALIDQALALTATGLLAGQQPRPGLAGKLGVLLAAMLAGFAALLYLPVFAWASLMPLAAAALAAGCIVPGGALPAWGAAGAVAFTGFAVGLNTIPQAGILKAFAYAIGGAMLGGGVLVAVLALPVSRLRRSWRRIGVRVAGS
jgi:hypothetical protein